MKLILKWFGWTLPVMHWAFFVTGIAGAIGTGASWLPPFNGSWWAKVTSILLWLVLAEQGYAPLAEKAQEKTDGVA